MLFYAPNRRVVFKLIFKTFQRDSLIYLQIIQIQSTVYERQVLATRLHCRIITVIKLPYIFRGNLVNGTNEVGVSSFQP